MFLQPFRGKTVSGHSSHHAGRSTRSVSGPLDNQHSRANVFDVSYSHIDAELATTIYNLLTNLEVNTFLDEKDIEYGRQPTSVCHCELKSLSRLAAKQTT